MPKYDFNKVARTSAWVFSCKFAAYFQNTFSLGTPLGGCFCKNVECRVYVNKILIKVKHKS